MEIQIVFTILFRAYSYRRRLKLLMVEVTRWAQWNSAQLSKMNKIHQNHKVSSKNVKWEIVNPMQPFNVLVPLKIGLNFEHETN